MNKILVVLGLLLILSLAICLMFFSEEIVVGEQLCVDGNKNINLEGIMCEKTETFLFSISISWFIIPFMVLLFFGLWVISIGVDNE